MRCRAGQRRQRLLREDPVQPGLSGSQPVEQERARTQTTRPFYQRQNRAGTRPAGQRTAHRRTSCQRVFRHRSAGAAFRAGYRYADHGRHCVDRRRALVCRVCERRGLPLVHRQGLLLRPGPGRARSSFLHRIRFAHHGAVARRRLVAACLGPLQSALSAPVRVSDIFEKLTRRANLTIVCESIH
ncbi:protein of unknown function [Paraburkholderia dioscoreae]|uniref:Uncharacterized protein n=1 Tax=Paraburkholderia dioscoreae TaxID=2604047 RepID=A0A5Q4ZNJ6_9BURK|nr:protein of unknown function [Paraburkholderia dioscoreae]